MLGTFVAHRWWAVVATTGVILGAVYMLWMFQRVFTGVPEGENATMADANGRELLVVIPLLALSLFIGLYPKPVLDRVEPTVKCVMSNFEQHAEFALPAVEKLKTGDAEGVPMIAIAAPRVDWYSIAPVVTLVAAGLIIILFKVDRARPRPHLPTGPADRHDRV